MTQFSAFMSLGAGIPTPVQLGGESIPGTVNLIRNPSLEDATIAATDWNLINGATGGRVTSTALQGSASFQVVVASGSTGDNDGATVITQTGLLEAGSDIFIGSIFVLGAFQGLQLILAATYTDATVETSVPVDVDYTTPGDWVRPSVAIETNASKTVDFLTLTVQRTSGTLGGTFWLDAAQVEPDLGFGMTEYATGQYGAPYHRWYGTPNLSMSIRDGIPVDTTQFGFEGRKVMQTQMWRTNISNQFLEDMSGYLIAATINADRDRDATWTMTCRMSDAGWKRLRTTSDWLSPILIIRDEQGKVELNQLGHYRVDEGVATHFEQTSEWDIICKSAEAVLGDASFSGKVVIQEGSRYDAFARWVIASEFGTTYAGTGAPRYFIPDINVRADKDYEFRENRSKLDIVNDCLEAMGCEPLGANNYGTMFANHYSWLTWDTFQPVRLWAANFAPDSTYKAYQVNNWITRIQASSNEVANTVRMLPRNEDQSNEFVVTSTDSRKPKVKGKRRIDDPSNPISQSWTKRKKRRYRRRRMVAQQAAQYLADGMARDAATKVTRIELTVMPSPAVDLIDNVVYCAIYRIDGYPVAVGRYRVLAVEYGLTPADGLMKLRLGFVHGVAELSGGVPIMYWDSVSQSFKPDAGAPIVLNFA